MPVPRGRLAVALTALVCATLPLAPPCAAEGRDALLKAAIILNIIRFVDFGVGPVSDPLLLCVARNSGAARALAALNGQRVGTRPIAAHDFDGDPGKCHVVYLGAGGTAAIARMRKTGVLLIGDGSDFVEAGGTIGLIGAGSQIRFEANTRAARAAQIKLSSKLLRLAARVR